MKHRWKHVSTKGDSVWQFLTWRCKRCGAEATATVRSHDAHEAKHRPGGKRTYGASADCLEETVRRVHGL